MAAPSKKILLGVGSPFAQARVDFNRLYGTDTSSGTNPFTSPGNLNDGSDTTHADRAADPHSTAYIVQSTSSVGGSLGATTTLAAPVTAGNLLVAAGRVDIDSSHVAHGGTGRAFTDFTDSPVQANATNITHLAYRIATGDEQTLDWGTTNGEVVLYEIALAAGSPGTYATTFKTNQAASNVKALAALSVVGALQIECYVWAGGSGGGGVDLDQVVAAGWTQDAQIGRPDSFGHYFDPGILGAHATTGPTPSISGGVKLWGGIAVGIPTGAADETSICQADLTTIRPVNRITLLEAAATGTQYGVSYSNDATTWTSVSPTFSAVGALQTYEFADTVNARYWRIADNHSPAVALAALTWDTWTIEGFPF